jgi:hypothetical protein
MGLGLLTILELCTLAGSAFLFIGLCMLLIATRKARREYRTKGFLRPPSGTAWFRFLLWRQYEYFENPSTRFLFGATHFCMMGAIIVLTGVAALVGTELLLNGVSGFSFNSGGGLQELVPK